jgi:NYN domain
MWGSLRSALFIDFENIGSRMTPAALRAMTAWLEDGKFDEAGRQRRLVSKRVYWNSSAEKHRDTFEAAGFEVVLCEKFSAMKNGADIRMALDVLDSCWRAPRIKEYILFTTDSDFVPVLQRLTERQKLSAILVNEATMVSHTAFSIYADLVVPVRELVSAGLTYAPPERRWLRSLVKGKPPDCSARPAGRATAAPARPSQAGATADQAKGKGAPAPSLLAQAERAVLRVASRTPQKFVPRKAIEKELQLIKGFKKAGPNAYLGKQHYQGLMLEVARMNRRIRVQQGSNNSASVMYVPEE